MYKNVDRIHSKATATSVTVCNTISAFKCSMRCLCRLAIKKKEKSKVSTFTNY